MAPNHTTLIAGRAAKNRWRLRWLEWRASLADRRLVAILLTERLGDLLASEPVAREARRRWPNALIVWFCTDRFEQVVRCFPAVDEVFCVVCLTEIIQLEPSLSNWTIIDLHLHGKECGECRIPKWRRQGNSEVTTENYYHYGSLLEAFTKAADFPVLDKTPQLCLPINVGSKIDTLNLPSNYVVIHCESDEPARNWNPIGWRMLREEIIHIHNLDIVEIGANPSGHLGLHPRVHDACGKLTILESTELIRRARLFIGIDSGPAHLANTMQTPGLLLTGRYRSFSHYQVYNGFYDNTPKSDVALIKHWQESPFIPASIVLNSLHELLGKKRPYLRKMPSVGCYKEYDLALSPLPPNPDAGFSLTFSVFDPQNIPLPSSCSPVAVLWDMNHEKHPHLLKELICSGRPVFYSFNSTTLPSELAISSLVEAIHSGNYLTAWGRPIIGLIGEASALPEHPALHHLRDALKIQIFGNPAWISFAPPTTEIAAITSSLWSTSEFNPNTDGLTLTWRRNELTLSRPANAPRNFSRVLHSSALKANIDSIQINEQGQLQLNGWSVLPEPWPRPADAVAISRVDKTGSAEIVFWSSTSHDARPDIAKYFNDQSLLFSGWHFELPLETISTSKTLELLICDVDRQQCFSIHSDLQTLLATIIEPKSLPPN